MRLLYRRVVPVRPTFRPKLFSNAENRRVEEGKSSNHMTNSVFMSDDKEVAFYKPCGPCFFLVGPAFAVVCYGRDVAVPGISRPFHFLRFLWFSIHHLFWPQLLVRCDYAGLVYGDECVRGGPLTMIQIERKLAYSEDLSIEMGEGCIMI